MKFSFDFLDWEVGQPASFLKNFIMNIDKLSQLEDERMETMASQSFQEWFKELNISRLYSNPEPMWKAKELNEQYDYRRKKSLFKSLLPSQ
jgi:predicted nucleic acid-binding protein